MNTNAIKMFPESQINFNNPKYFVNDVKCSENTNHEGHNKIIRNNNKKTVHLSFTFADTA